MWTDFYTDYSFEQSYDAFSRFRTGEYPIVISNYTFYNQLTAASPEIKGLWDFTSVPGTMNADGEISHAVNSNGSGAVIFSSCANKKGAWEFIKWFTSDEIQTEYAVQTEGILGTLGRFDTANIAALSNLSWSDNELEKLMTQRNEISEIPIIPASYAVTRNIMNAFREAVNKSENPRDTLLWYNKDINEEIIRKNKTLK
jgi:ABC-type glycerol-3-phosphate transport system substrate-binding protein